MRSTVAPRMTRANRPGVVAVLVTQLVVVAAPAVLLWFLLTHDMGWNLMGTPPDWSAVSLGLAGAMAVVSLATAAWWWGHRLPLVVVDALAGGWALLVLLGEGGADRGVIGPALRLGWGLAAIAGAWPAWRVPGPATRH